MRLITGLLTVSAVVACSDPFKPTTESILGMYRAESFTADSGGTSRDLVAAGDFGFHLARDIPDAVGVADRGTAELENDARHGPARKRGIDTGGTIRVKGGHGR